MSKTVFLGVEGSGKTTLTMALARAFESHKSEGWYLKPLSRDSFRFLKTLPETLDGNFPSQTADLRELRWQAEYKGHDLGEIAILDYPGEIYRLAFLDEKDERDPEAFRQKVASNKPEIDALLGAIKEAEDVFVLFNLADGMDLRNNPRNLDAVWVTNECLKLLKRLESKPRIRLLFTQVDRYRDAGLDLSSFSPKSIDLIGHDHSDVPWSLVSIVDATDSEYGIDAVVRLLTLEPLQTVITKLMPKDFGDIDVAKLIPYRYASSVSADKGYLETINKSVNVAEEICLNEDWLIRDLTEVLESDWRKMAEVVSGIDNASIADLNVKLDFAMLESQWGKDTASRINDRINSVKKLEVERTQNDGAYLMMTGVIFIIIIIIIIIISIGSAQ